jgi:hypothetical protein
MALAFKRAQAEAEKAVVSANASIKDWYKPPCDPALIIDYDGIKAVEGVSKQNPNSVEGPKNISLCNWIKDYASRFHSVWGDVQYKDKLYALPILNQHLDKVIVHMDDKGVAGKYNSYAVEWKGKDLHITVHIDFTNYPQQLSLTDEKQGVHVDQAVWNHLDEVANITYEMRKSKSLNYESSQYNTYKKYLKDKIKKEIPIEVDWDSVFKLEGSSQEYSNHPAVPNRARGVYFLEDGKGFYYIYYAIETLVKDQMGMEAFLETFDKIHVSVAPGSTETRSGPHSVTKDGKTLKFQFKLNLNDLTNASADYGAMAKVIESLL